MAGIGGDINLCSACMKPDTCSSMVFMLHDQEIAYAGGEPLNSMYMY